MKKPLSYYAVMLLLHLTALLPLRVLYLCADMLYFLIYKVARYRRHVVRENLEACFPDKNAAELRRMEKDFYRHFADLFVETIKLLHISDAAMSRRMQFEGLDIIDNLTAEGRDVAVYFSHCGNWEWAPSVTLHASHTADIDYCQVYRPLRSRVFDAVMLRIRSRFGSLSFPKSTVLRDLLLLRRQNIVSVTGFMSDQKPSHGDPTVPLMFLNRPTAFISGTETLVRRMKMAAVYWDMEKLSRGHYRIICRLITDGTTTSESGSVTKTYASMLQMTILRNPSIWLWTHKRWKIPVTLP